MTLKFAKPDRLAQPTDRIDYRTLPIAKNPPEADPRFKTYVRALGCQLRGKVDQSTGQAHVCQRHNGKVFIEFAHYRTAGTALKGSDRGNGMGLCHVAHHQLQHQHGWPEFARRFGIDPEQICTELQAQYESKFGTK